MAQFQQRDMIENQPLSQYLKQATHAHHQSLDQRVALDFSADPTVVERRYVHLLRATYLFVQAIEGPLNQSLKTLAPQPWQHGLQRLPALEADLRDLSSAKPTPALPESCFQTLPQALGALYVLEGAALGGRVICKHLRQMPRLAAKCAFRYHGVDSEALSARWRMVLKCLNTWCANDDYGEAGQSAQQVFSLFETALDQCLHEPD